MLKTIAVSKTFDLDRLSLSVHHYRQEHNNISMFSNIRQNVAYTASQKFHNECFVLAEPTFKGQARLAVGHKTCMV